MEQGARSFCSEPGRPRPLLGVQVVPDPDSSPGSPATPVSRIIIFSLALRTPLGARDRPLYH